MPNPLNILVSRSNFDLPTAYLSSWIQPVLVYAAKLGYNVKDLYAVDNTIQKFVDSLASNNPQLVIIASHGNQNQVTCQNNELLMQACTNDDLMKSRTAFLVACQTGIALGPSMFKKGASAYLGWTADFVFMVKPGFESHPLDDPHAQPYFDAVNTIACALLDGKTLREAYEAGIDRFDYWINKWWNVPDPSASEIIQWLQWDRDNFIVITEGGLYETPARSAVSIPQQIPLLLFFGLAFLWLTRKS